MPACGTYSGAEVVNLVGSERQLQRLITEGKFPRPFYTGGTTKNPRGKRFWQQEVDAWAAARAADGEKSRAGARLVSASMLQAKRAKGG
jgi:predicted DNA-binding transcriptional regulator AlpA